jgi:hypothetical protein
VVDVLVGPAGAGKTRTLAALRTVWEAEHGAGSVVGLAPSAAAAEVLGASLGIPCENTAKWLTEHDLEPERRRRLGRIRDAVVAAADPAAVRALATAARATEAEIERWRFRAGKLVVVDEASLAGTLDLDRITSCVGEAGAKLLLVGDWAQLSSVEAGGAFGLLVRERGSNVPELADARRFTHAWEREASIRLRIGQPGSIDDYAAHGRIVEGVLDDVVEAAWAGWTADERAGLGSLMVAADRATVRTLNERARAERVTAGVVHPVGVALHDGLTAGVGDRIVTRHNERRLPVASGWVKNGDTWTVTEVTVNGGLVVTRAAGGRPVQLPPAYVASHVELGYATTAHRAQGATVDTAHAVVAGAGTSREVLYVMLTRGREANHVYVATDRDLEPLTGFADEPATGRGILLGALTNPGAAISAHEVEADERRDAATSIRTVAAEYETLASIAQAPRWTMALRQAGLTSDVVRSIEASPAYGALSAALRRAEARGLDAQGALPWLVARIQAGTRDPAAVLHSRVEAWVAGEVRSGRAGALGTAGELLPLAVGDVPADFASALEDRRRLMAARVDVLLDRAERAGAAWLPALGPKPSGAAEIGAWSAARRAVAAYRDLYGVDDLTPLGPDVPGNLERSAAREHVEQLLDRVSGGRRIGREPPPSTDRVGAVLSTPAGRTVTS